METLRTGDGWFSEIRIPFSTLRFGPHPENGWGINLNWIPRPGSDLFLVINHQAETMDSPWVPLQTTVLSKLVWRIAL